MMGRSFLDAVRRALWSVPEDLVCNLSGPLGLHLRRAYWRLRLRRCGRRVTFGVGVRIYNPEWVSIGDDSWIDDYVLILAGPVGMAERNLEWRDNPAFTGEPGEVILGARIHVAPFVLLSGHGGLFVGDDSGIATGAKVYSASHHYRSGEHPDSPESPYCGTSTADPGRQTVIASPVVLEDCTVVALNAAVLPGTTIRRGAWVGIGTVARGEVRAGEVMGVRQDLATQRRWE